MDTKLPPPIAAYFRAANTHNTDLAFAQFTSDALVADGGHEYRGAAVKEWLDRTNEQYQPNTKVIDFTSTGDQIVVAAEVSGTFPGSPIQLHFTFTLRDGGIAALSIGD
jgi:SnoaL-like domain